MTSVICFCFLIFCVCIVGYRCSQTFDSGIKEYCTFDTFEPVCSEDEVILIQHAMYGRMRVGTCLTTNFYIGCSANVLQITDLKCSGQRRCSITIPHPEMTEAIECLEEPSLLAAAYLEVSDTCIKVTMPQRKACSSPEQIEVASKINYLSSMVTQETSCGLHNSPWILTSQPGQLIELSLLDFSWDNASIPEDGEASRNCLKNYGYVLDVESDDVINICGGSYRNKHLYTSRSYTIQVVFNPQALEKYTFLLAYQAIGCPDFKAPPHTWQDKENDSLVIGCVSSNKTWKMLCVNNMWLGRVGNCTPPSTTLAPTINPPKTVKQVEKPTGNKLTLPVVETNHVIAFTFGCVTLIVCCSVVVMGIYCTKRYEIDKLKPYRQDTTAKPLIHDGYRTLIVKTPQTGNLQNPENPPTYSAALPKDERPPPPPERRHSAQPKRDRNSDYLRPCGGDVGGDESVHYYILENLTDGTEGEKVYQNL